MEKHTAILKIHETITEIIEDLILVCDPEGQIVFTNRAMQTSLGYKEEELRQYRFRDIITGPHRSKADTFLMGASEKPSLWEEFLLLGRHEVRNLHLKFCRKDDLIYIQGNEIYVAYEKLSKKLDVEIANAVRIHKRSLPSSLPESDEVSFASLYIPAEKLGGDLYDAFRVDNGLLNDYFEQYVCYLADVSGHGLDSAMLAMFVKDTIRSYFRLKHNPGQVLSPKEIMDFFIEQYMKEGYPEEYLVCLFIVVFDMKTQELIYCNAGFHMCPLLVRDEDHMLRLSNAGMPISTAIRVSLLQYDDTSLPLSPAMTLFLMSDGLPEQRAAGEFYEERFLTLIPEVFRLNPVQIVQRIQDDFDAFRKYEAIKDDVTLVVVQISGT